MWIDSQNPPLSGETGPEVQAQNAFDDFYVDFKTTISASSSRADGTYPWRLTMVNGFELSELALAKGKPADGNDNPAELTFMLAKRTARTWIPCLPPSSSPTTVSGT